MIGGTYGCESITLTPGIVRRYVEFNTRCLSAMSGRTTAAERSEPTFDIMSWIHWRRARWLGKALRGVKGGRVLNAVHWGFMHREHGDVFSDLPPVMTTSFFVLCKHACDTKGWVNYCKTIKPEKWIRRDNDGEVRRRRSSRIASRADRAANNTKTSTG